MAAWEPRKLNPSHYRILTLHWRGLPHGEIALEVGVTTQTVSNVVTSESGQAVLEELARRTLDTALDVQTVAQAYAPGALEELVKLAFSSRDERVKKTACTDILAMAGHAPVRRVSIERPDPVDERFKGKSEVEMRAEILKRLGYVEEPSDAPESSTLH